MLKFTTTVITIQKKKDIFVNPKALFKSSMFSDI